MIEARPGGIRIAIRVVPRASRNEVVEWAADGTLRVRIKAPPVEGEANAELIRWLARLLGVPKSSVRLAHGSTGRSKVIDVDGITADAAGKALKEGARK